MLRGHVFQVNYASVTNAPDEMVMFEDHSLHSLQRSRSFTERALDRQPRRNVLLLLLLSNPGTLGHRACGIHLPHNASAEIVNGAKLAASCHQHHRDTLSMQTLHRARR